MVISLDGSLHYVYEAKHTLYEIHRTSLKFSVSGQVLVFESDRWERGGCGTSLVVESLYQRGVVTKRTTCGKEVCTHTVAYIRDSYMFTNLVELFSDAF